MPLQSGQSAFSGAFALALINSPELFIANFIIQSLSRIQQEYFLHLLEDDRANRTERPGMWFHRCCAVL